MILFITNKFYHIYPQKAMLHFSYRKTSPIPPLVSDEMSDVVNYDLFRVNTAPTSEKEKAIGAILPNSHSNA